MAPWVIGIGLGLAIAGLGLYGLAEFLEWGIASAIARG